MQSSAEPRRDPDGPRARPVGRPDGDGPTPTDDGSDPLAWALRLYVKPFVDWIWGGCFLMALGGFIAMTDRRYRVKAAAHSPAPPVSLAQNA